MSKMKTIMAAKSPHDSSFSFSRRYFHWKKKALDDDEEILNISPSSHFPHDEDDDDDDDDEKEKDHHHLRFQMQTQLALMPLEKKKHSKSKLKSALTVFSKTRSFHNSSSLGTRVVGTLFGYRRGHVHFAFQEGPKLSPAFLIELATPTSVLVREMASGLVRIALECENKKANNNKKKGSVKLLEEPLWRTYCNGRKCGYAKRLECGEEEWKILKAVEPISMGAGVLPMPFSSNSSSCSSSNGGGNGAAGSEGELMYMRAKYERVVGSQDSEAFYMINPDCNGGPELSIYLLRV